ncbi:MAG: hypothetical protein H7A41_05235 [Chlamydiales bacterium]|nr:hypothetical protein [Chlamydiales bacterium]
MESLRRPSSSPRREEPPPYQPPSPGDRLFYLLLTVSASTVVYKSFPKSLRGIATLGVASFGIYHALGMNCDCIKRVVFNIFGKSPGDGSGRSDGSSGGWGCFHIPYPWEISQGRGGFGLPPSSHTGAVDQGVRQEKRRKDPSRTWEVPPSTYSSPPYRPPESVGRDGLGRSSSHSTPSVLGFGVDSGARQPKRREERRSPSPPLDRGHSSLHDLRSFSSHSPSTGSVDPRERQEKRRGHRVDSQGYEVKDPWKQ